jgi:hypothetical protein
MNSIALYPLLAAVVTTVSGSVVPQRTTKIVLYVGTVLFGVATIIIAGSSIIAELS